jgi:hypothetical protein
MPTFKKLAALTAMSAFAATASFAQDAEEENCRTQAEFTAEMENEHGEMLIDQEDYEGKDFIDGTYSLYVNPQTGGWTFALDPDEPFEESSCEADDATYHFGGDNSGYPDMIQFLPWYEGIFKGPKFL